MSHLKSTSLPVALPSSAGTTSVSSLVTENLPAIHLSLQEIFPFTLPNEIYQRILELCSFADRISLSQTCSTAWHSRERDTTWYAVKTAFRNDPFHRYDLLQRLERDSQTPVHCCGFQLRLGGPPEDDFNRTNHNATWGFFALFERHRSGFRVPDHSRQNAHLDCAIPCGLTGSSPW